MIRRFQIYSETQLSNSGIKFGEKVHISSDVIFNNPENIIIGNNVRIDTQCVLIAGQTTKIIIGDNVHISAGCYYYGNSGNITLEDNTCTSARCILYTSNDDYTDGYMTNSTVHDKYKNVKTGDIVLKKHVVVGCYSVILPGVILEYATSAGAYSFIKESTYPYYIIAGIPAKFIKYRESSNLI